MSEHYLGDGLYVRFDGFMLWLRAPRPSGDHIVGLEPAVFKELLRFVEHTARNWCLNKGSRDDQATR